MLFFYLTALPLLLFAVITALLWLPSKSTGWFVRLDVGLAWFAALATLILVPTDVATTLLRAHPGYLGTWWKAVYWYGFMVQVLVIPLHMEFTRSGEFTIPSRMSQSVRNNLIYYGVLAGVGLAGLLLLLVTRHLRASNVVGFCIAFSNAYGLIAGIFLLGYGLVAIPRQLWKCADLRGEKRRLEHQAGAQQERAVEAHRVLSEAVLTTRRASILFPSHDPMRPYMDAVLALANSVGPSFQPSPDANVPDESEMDYFDRQDLARLRRQVKRALKDYERERALYIEAVHAYLRVEEVLARVEGGQAAPAGAGLRERALWVWRCHLHFWAFRALAVLCALCSAAIVVAEATISGVIPNSSLFSWALHSMHAQQFRTELLCLLCLAYPCACAYYAIYRLGQFSFYRLVPRHTDAYSLCYSALLMCRFAPPLAFNFMAAVAMPITNAHPGPDVTDTVFYRIFGELMMRQPLIGWHFTTFVPLALVPYIALLLLGAFNPLMTGVSRLFRRSAELTFEDDWETTSSLAAAGRRLLRLESENSKNGLPLGLTLEPGRGLADASLLHGELEEGVSQQIPWWRRLFGGGGNTGSAAGASKAPRRAEAEAARSRLSRAVAAGGGSRAGPQGRRYSAGGRPKGGSRHGEGRRADVAVAPDDVASPTRRLLSGEGSEGSVVGDALEPGLAGGGGDIFSGLGEARAERHGWQRGLGEGGLGARLTQVPRSPLRSVDVESLDGEERGGQTSWLARFTRKE